jgi:L-alanine-DL-glutamate epimerase-like enolase superfamily enzyme
LWIIFVRSTRFGRSRHVRFAPIASESSHRSDSTRCANPHAGTHALQHKTHHSITLLALAALCATAGVAMAHHEESQIAQHLMSAILHGTYIECFADPERDPIWQRMWINRPAIKDGMMGVSQGPGFGLELDVGMIAKYAVA